MLVKITDFIRVLGKKDMGGARRWIPELSRGPLGVHAHWVGPAESASTCSTQRPSEDIHMLDCLAVA